MKKLLIPLLSLSTIGTIVTATSCSCTFGKKDELTPLSVDYLDIRNGTLYGFKDQYKFIESIPEGNYKLSIPKDVSQLDVMAFAYARAADGDSQLLIKEIDFEKDCTCTSFGTASFSGCINLEKVVLPPKFNNFGSSLFQNCPKLKSFDLTNVTENVTFPEEWYSPMLDSGHWYFNGNITYLKDNNNQKTLANKMLAQINKQPVSGQPNQWTLIEK